MAWLLEHKANWPGEVALTEATVFPILSNGQPIGEGSAPAGASVRLLGIDLATSSATVAYAPYGNSTRRIPIQKTDLRQRAVAALSKAEADARIAAMAPSATPRPAEEEPAQRGTPYVTADRPTVVADGIVFGDSRSEQVHALKADKSEMVHGEFDQPARRLLPGGAEPWEGGTMAFTLKSDSRAPVYFTARFWGGEGNVNRLVLYCEGKQIGYRHLGDVDLLDVGETEDPPCNGRFYYVTVPLPSELTRGKSELHFEIRSLGPIFAYATTFEKFQRAMEGPTRGIYCAYTHADPCFVPPTNEKQGAEPAAPKRGEPGEEVLREMKQHLTATISNHLVSDKPLNQTEALILARAYGMKWSPAFHNAKAVEQVIKSVDALCDAWKKDEKKLLDDPATQNPGWFAAGPAAGAVALLDKQVGPFLYQKMANGKLRRAAWLEMFVFSRDWLRYHRRLYTNQSMIVDMNLYRSNRAVAVVDKHKAMPEDKALHYLYESVGLQPWLGSDTDHGPEKPVGDDYFQLTEKGLTKELGYVGGYGEVLSWLTQLYDSTRPEPGQPGDRKLLDQIDKIEHARAAFRYPAPDAEGNRAMRLETIVGWRDHGYPGEIVYAEKQGRDTSPIDAVAATLDPQAIGYAQQMLADNQFFAALQEMLRKRGLFETLGMLGAPNSYDTLRTQKTSASRLPMTDGQPDFVFSDEEDGVVALKNGRDVLYVSLYWRANRAVNFLGRVHYINPVMDRIATVREDAKFLNSGMTFERPDDIQFIGAPWIPRYPVNTGSAVAGERLPIARIPAGVKFREGDESIYAGKADFYTLQYGPYLIGMNLSKNQDFELVIPTGMRSAKELVSGKTISFGGSLKVPPKSTVVVYTGVASGKPGALVGSR